jgi:hypothetical protein
VRVFAAFRKTLLSMYLAPFLLYLSSVLLRFFNHYISPSKPAISRRFATFQRCTTLQQHSTTQR